MSLPSVVLDAIVTRLTTLIGSNALSIKAHDGNFGSDQLANITLNVPGILLVCTEMPLVPQDYEPPTAACRFIALCVAKNGASSKSKGDVAMDLASLVLGHVSRERWSNNCIGQATRVSAVNMTNHMSLDKGTALWAVSWTQNIELTPPDLDSILNRLAEINIDIYQGEEESPGTQLQLLFPEE